MSESGIRAVREPFAHPDFGEAAHGACVPPDFGVSGGDHLGRLECIAQEIEKALDASQGHAGEPAVKKRRIIPADSKRLHGSLDGLPVPRDTCAQDLMVGIQKAQSAATVQRRVSQEDPRPLPELAHSELEAAHQEGSMGPFEALEPLFQDSLCEIDEERATTGASFFENIWNEAAAKDLSATAAAGHPAAGKRPLEDVQEDSVSEPQVRRQKPNGGTMAPAAAAEKESLQSKFEKETECLKPQRLQSVQSGIDHRTESQKRAAEKHFKAFEARQARAAAADQQPTAQQAALSQQPLQQLQRSNGTIHRLFELGTKKSTSDARREIEEWYVKIVPQDRTPVEPGDFVKVVFTVVKRKAVTGYLWVPREVKIPSHAKEASEYPYVGEVPEEPYPGEVPVKEPRWVEVEVNLPEFGLQPAYFVAAAADVGNLLTFNQAVPQASEGLRSVTSRFVYKIAEEAPGALILGAIEVSVASLAGLCSMSRTIPCAISAVVLSFGAHYLASFAPVPPIMGVVKLPKERRPCEEEGHSWGPSSDNKTAVCMQAADRRCQSLCPC